MTRRRLTAALVAIGVAGAPATAYADPAGPTDYQTEITAITPATDAIELSVEGGDSFVRVVADPGVEVLVLGYDDEPYVMIDAAGDVYENVLSFAAYYNDTRYGTSAIPPTVDNAAEPQWERVGSGGAWAWHDHRAHWMATEAPVGMQPGDSFPPEIIPIVVDGERVEIEVVSTLVAGPSWAPTVLGALAGLVLALAATVRWRMTVLSSLAWSVVALGVGATQFLSLPAETGPSPIWWLAPAVAVVASAGAVWWRRSLVVSNGLMTIAALQVLLWVGVRRLTFVRPILPTSMPYWLDRAASAAALAGSVVVLAAAGAAIAAALRQAPRASSIAASSAS